MVAARPRRTWVPTSLMRHVEPEVVIHLAGKYAANARSTRLGRRCARTSWRQSRFSTRLLVSAVGESSSAGRFWKSRGTAQATPPSPYGASRWASSAYARMFHALFGLPVVILRPSFAYGPGQERTKLVLHVITGLLAGESPELSSVSDCSISSSRPTWQRLTCCCGGARDRGRDDRHRRRNAHDGS